MLKTEVNAKIHEAKQKKTSSELQSETTEKSEEIPTSLLQYDKEVSDPAGV